MRILLFWNASSLLLEGVPRRGLLALNYPEEAAETQEWYGLDSTHQSIRKNS